jgi:YegS/Rv2252/BmrU family lipid kinase
MILYNPRAGRGKSVKLAKEAVQLFRKHDIDLKPQHLQFGVNPFVNEMDVELVIVCGGDGSINYVVNCMRQLGINPTLGIVPMGTANDLANALNLSPFPNVALKRILEGEIHKIDCCKVNDRYFVNILSFGVLTTTSQHTSDIAKHLIGKLAYLRKGVVDLLNLHHIPLKLRYNGEEIEVDAAMFLAFNGNSAGQFKLAPKSNIEDGKLDILILDYDNTARTCWNMMSYLINGKSEAVHHLRCERLEVDCNIEEHTDIDGQPGPQMPLSIECLAGALKIKA